MQLMPQTASTLGVKDSFDPTENVDGGVRYLRELLMQYNGDAAKALAAYNAGPHRVRQYGGVPPYRETHVYVARIINDYNRKKAAEVHRQAQPAHEGSALSRRPRGSEQRRGFRAASRHSRFDPSLPVNYLLRLHRRDRAFVARLSALIHEQKTNSGDRSSPRTAVPVGLLAGACVEEVRLVHVLDQH